MSESPIFEEGVRVIMDHRLAGLDFATSSGKNEDEMQRREEVARALGAEVHALRLVISRDDYAAMTEEACSRLQSLSSNVDELGGAL